MRATPPKMKQRDGHHADLVVHGDDAVRKLVKKYGSKKQQAGGEANCPVLRDAPLRVQLSELHCQGIGDQRENQQPTGVQIDGDSENAADAKA